MVLDVLEKSAIEVTDVLTNTMLIEGSVEQSIVPFSTSLINYNYKEITKKLESIVNGEEGLHAKANRLATTYAENAQTIAAWLVYAEARIKGYISDEEAESMLDSITKGLSDAGTFWLINTFLERSSFKVLANLIAYGTDIKYENSGTAPGDIPKNIDKLLQAFGYPLKDETKNFMMYNSALGGIVAFVFTFGAGVAFDKGIRTSSDWGNYGISAFANGVLYFTWGRIVAGTVGAEAAGLAAAPGVALAAGTVFVLSKLWNEIYEYHFSQNAKVDEYESYILKEDGRNADGTKKYKKLFEYRKKDGTTYFAEKPESKNDTKVTIAVPRNGSGKDGTYDVLIEKYEEKAEIKSGKFKYFKRDKYYQTKDENGNYTTKEGPHMDYRMNGEPCTEQYYKRKMYTNWEDVCTNTKNTTSSNSANEFNKLLNEIKNAKSHEEREKIVKSFEEYYKYAPKEYSSDPRVEVYTKLKSEHFDLKEYIDYLELMGI